MDHAVAREKVTSQPETQQVDSPELNTVAKEATTQNAIVMRL